MDARLAPGDGGEMGGILPPVSLFLPLSSFLPLLLHICPIVRPYLSVKPLGREKEGVEAVNLGETTLLSDTILERQPVGKTES